MPSLPIYLFRLILVTTLLPSLVGGQESLPSAPSAIPVRTVAPAPAPPVARCGPWKCWDYPNERYAQVLKTTRFLTFVATDIGAQAFDDVLTKNGIAHQDHKPFRNCVEKNVDPPSPTGAQLIKSGLPELGAVAAVGFIASKVKMPTWMMFGTEAYSVQTHLRNGLGWAENCF